MSIFGKDPFEEQKGGSVRQLVLLLGPLRAGKTELLMAIKDLRKIGERNMGKILEEPESQIATKAATKATHSITTSPVHMAISRKIRLFMASLFFKDGSGLEERQVERIQSFIKNLINPRPRKWKDGVLGVIVFNICDIIDMNADLCRDIESSYRDLLETWGNELYPPEEDEEYLSKEAEMKGIKRKTKRKPFRPQLSVIFVGTHLDFVPQDAVSEIQSKVLDFVHDMEKSAKHCLALPPKMAFPPSDLVLADLKSLNGRLEFAKKFYQIRKQLTEVMKGK